MPPENGAVPKKYIRTFATDLAALEQTNPEAAELASAMRPATPASAAPAPQLGETKLPAANILAPQAAAIPKTVPVALPEPEPAPEPVPVPLQAPEPIRLAPLPVPEPEAPIELPPVPLLKEPLPPPLPPEPITPPPPPPAPEPAPLPAPRSADASPLQTYAGDFTERVKEQNASTTAILAAEGDRAQKAPVLWKETDRSTVWYIVGGVALLLIAIVTSLYFYGEYLSKHAPVVLAPTVSAPIFVDDRAELSGSGAQLLAGVTQSVSDSLGRTGVRLLYTPESLSGTSTVFSALALPAPGALTRNVNQTGGMTGVINANGTQSPFFIISVTSYADTFAGMLAWEPTMPQDVAALFPAYPAPAIVAPVATTTATSTAKTTKTAKKGKTTSTASTTPPLPPPPAPGFYDDTISNHDVREYRDSQSRVVFLYGYWDQQTLVLARDVAAFAEIVNRLANSRTH